jgi:hypothetical protein
MRLNFLKFLHPTEDKMAGKPVAKVIRPIEALAAEAGLSGPEFVYDWIAGGGTVTSLAARIGTQREYLSRNLSKYPEYVAVMDAARKVAADTLVEESKHLIDDIAEEAKTNESAKFSDRIRAVELQANQRRFMAASYNQDRYGNRGSNVTINLGDLHLEALRKVKVQPTMVIDHDAGE